MSSKDNDDNNDWKISRANPAMNSDTAIEYFLRSLSKFGIAGNFLLKAYSAAEDRNYLKASLWISFAMLLNNEIYSNLNDYIKFIYKTISIYVFPFEYRTLTGTANSNVQTFSTDIRSDLLVNAVLSYIDHNHKYDLNDAIVSFEYNSAESSKQVKSSLNKTYEYFAKFVVKKTPIPNVWIRLPNTSIEFRTMSMMTEQSPGNNNSLSPPIHNNGRRSRRHHHNDDNETSDDPKQIPTMQLEFRNLRNKGGSKSIDDFISNAIKHNLKIIEDAGGPSRYYMTYKKVIGQTATPCYQAYPLYESKTFDSLFFDKKDELLKRVDAFMKKEGKYSLKGYPYKLGLLLSGPPGTGKTSFIKAIASKTGRSILNINLNKVTTNAELYQIMFNRQFYIEDSNGYSLMQLDYNDCIFVFEDVDAQSSVVIDRKLKEIAKEVYQIEPPKKITVDDDDGNSGFGTSGFGTSGFGAPNGGRGNTRRKPSTKNDDESEASELKNKSTEEVEKILATLNADNDDTKKKLEMYKKWYRSSRDNTGDELDLSGLLNVLDGILETPGRIIIMTSNYPELLDSAILRPGRIDRYEVLSYINEISAIQMLEHYFKKKLDFNERNVIIQIINNPNDVKFTPAEIST